eukprot:Awhi_evm1s1372
MPALNSLSLKNVDLPPIIPAPLKEFLTISSVTVDLSQNEEIDCCRNFFLSSNNLTVHLGPYTCHNPSRGSYHNVTSDAFSTASCSCANFQTYEQCNDIRCEGFYWNYTVNECKPCEAGFRCFGTNNLKENCLPGEYSLGGEIECKKCLETFSFGCKLQKKGCNILTGETLGCDECDDGFTKTNDFACIPQICNSSEFFTSIELFNKTYEQKWLTDLDTDQSRMDIIECPTGYKGNIYRFCLKLESNYEFGNPLVTHKCQRCYPPYGEVPFIDDDDNKEDCIVCDGLADENCIDVYCNTSSSYVTCTQCASGYVLTNHSCSKCDEQCKECSSANVGHCTECLDGKSPYDGTCGVIEKQSLEKNALTGLIIGVTISAIVIIIVTSLLIIYFHQKRQKAKHEKALKLLDMSNFVDLSTESEGKKEYMNSLINTVEEKKDCPIISNVSQPLDLTLNDQVTTSAITSLNLNEPRNIESHDAIKENREASLEYEKDREVGTPHDYWGTDEDTVNETDHEYWQGCKEDITSMCQPHLDKDEYSAKPVHEDGKVDQSTQKHQQIPIEDDDVKKNVDNVNDHDKKKQQLSTHSPDGLTKDIKDTDKEGDQVSLQPVDSDGYIELWKTSPEIATKDSKETERHSHKRGDQVSVQIGDSDDYIELWKTSPETATKDPRETETHNHKGGDQVSVQRVDSDEYIELWKTSPETATKDFKETETHNHKEGDQVSVRRGDSEEGDQVSVQRADSDEYIE